ncbi:MAG: response regulator transcription factor [Melioribacteraceae bacterium]|nr:response regulator transcription factor [Melioribacteraceae bacterium]
MLKKETDMQVVATVSDGENILQKIEKKIPHIVLLDLGLSKQISINVVKTIKSDYPNVKIIVMDLIPLEADVYEFVQAGVSGFILKDANINEFFKTIRSVYKGDKVLPSHLTFSLFSQIVEHALNGSKETIIKESVQMTKREKQVIDLIADGSTNKEIAQVLHLSPYTIKSHVHNILEKLALNTRVQIAKHAYLSESN